jgi:hypothetical protein
LTAISYAEICHTYMEVVPSLGDLSSAIVGRAFTGSSLVVARSAASNVGQSAVSLGKGILELTDRVGGSVARCDASCVQPAECRKATIVENGSLEELYDLLVFHVLRTIARHVEGGEAGAVLAELMFIELVVGRSLIDPILIHPCQKVIFAKGLNKGLDTWALVRRNDGAIRQRVGSVGRWLSVILPREVTILGIRAIAKVWPQSVECPVIGRQQLTLRLKTGVCGPELGREEESSVCFGAARVDGVGVGGAGAGQDGVGVGCKYTALASAHCCRITRTHSIDKCG